MSPPVRKAVLAAHLACSVGWIGAAADYLALAIAAEASADPATVRASWIAMELTGWYVLVPLALGALLSGLVMALGSRWGLLRHYWVLISLLLTVVAAAVLVMHMPTVSSLADRARVADAAGLEQVGTDLVHPGVGLVVLFAIQVLNVYKPHGMTRYGQRRLGAGARPPGELLGTSSR